MSGRRGRSSQGGSSSSGVNLALSAAVAAAGAIAGAVAVEHAQAQAEGRPSLVENAWRWVTEELLGDEPSTGFHTNTNTNNNNHNRRGYGRLSAADVAALPTREYAPCSADQEEDATPHQKAFCPVCQEAFQERDKLLRLPCFHEMHAECISDYLCSSERSLCPVCRHPVADLTGNTPLSDPGASSSSSNPNPRRRQHRSTGNSE